MVPTTPLGLYVNTWALLYNIRRFQEARALSRVIGIDEAATALEHQQVVFAQQVACSTIFRDGWGSNIMSVHWLLTGSLRPHHPMWY